MSNKLVHLENKIADLSGWALLKVNVFFCLPQQLFGQAWGGRFDQSSLVQTTSLPSCLFSCRSMGGGRALQRGLWVGRARSLGLIPSPAGLFWQGGASWEVWDVLCHCLDWECVSSSGESWHIRAWLWHVCRAGEIWKPKGVCSSWSSGCGPVGLIPGSCSWFESALAAPKRDFLQSRALAKKSGAGSDRELAEDKPSW